MKQLGSTAKKYHILLLKESKEYKSLNDKTKKLNKQLKLLQEEIKSIQIITDNLLREYINKEI